MYRIQMTIHTRNPPIIEQYRIKYGRIPDGKKYHRQNTFIIVLIIAWHIYEWKKMKKLTEAAGHPQSGSKNFALYSMEMPRKQLKASRNYENHALYRMVLIHSPRLSRLSSVKIMSLYSEEFLQGKLKYWQIYALKRGIVRI